MTTHQIASSFKPGVHGTTFGGNPLACAVAKKAVEIISDEHFLEQVRAKSDFIKQTIAKLNQQTPIFRQIRGEGLLIGAELIEKYHGKAMDFCHLANQYGLMLLVAGPNVVRLAPALNISQTELEEGLNKFAKTMTEFAK